MSVVSGSSPVALVSVREAELGSAPAAARIAAFASEVRRAVVAARMRPAATRA